MDKIQPFYLQKVCSVEAKMGAKFLPDCARSRINYVFPLFVFMFLCQSLQSKRIVMAFNNSVI